MLPEFISTPSSIFLLTLPPKSVHSFGVSWEFAGPLGSWAGLGCLVLWLVVVGPFGVLAYS